MNNRHILWNTEETGKQTEVRTTPATNAAETTQDAGSTAGTNVQQPAD